MSCFIFLWSLSKFLTDDNESDSNGDGRTPCWKSFPEAVSRKDRLETEDQTYPVPTSTGVAQSAEVNTISPAWIKCIKLTEYLTCNALIKL